MKTIEEILNNYKKDWEIFLDDRFGVRLCKFLTEEQMERIGFRYGGDSSDREIKEWTRENIIEQLRDDVSFGFEKALNKRSISSSLMFEVVMKWNKVLEEGLEDYDEDNGYAQYGLPLFKATALKYGFDNPIGEDRGDEDCYKEEE